MLDFQLGTEKILMIRHKILILEGLDYRVKPDNDGVYFVGFSKNRLRLEVKIYSGQQCACAGMTAVLCVLAFEGVLQRFQAV